MTKLAPIACIYFDLDETLINAVFYHKLKRVKIVVGDEKYYALCRPLAHQMLKDSRSLAPVKMMTTAVHAYAMALNEAFELGFDASDIISREDYMGGDVSEAIEQNPNHILIDNLPQQEPHPILKMACLGIAPERYIQIREFKGQDPEPKFSQEWAAIQDEICKLLQL